MINRSYLHFRSKLAVLPEEGQLSRRESMNESNKDANGYIQVPPRRSKSNNPDLESAQSECGLMNSASDFDEVPQSGNVYTSLRARKMALRRKRSLSVADLPVSRSSKTGHGTKMAEESGYDSDVTRKSSPRGSLKNCGSENSSKTDESSNKDTDSVSSGSEDSALNNSNKQQKMEQKVKEKKDLPMIKKPPRKSKLPEPVSKNSPANGRRFKKNGENESSSNNENSLSSNSGNSGPPSLNSDSAGSANNLPSLTSKRFKMLRLKKDVSGELGIIISKKRHPQKGTTGYIIAHVEPGGLVER